MGSNVFLATQTVAFTKFCFANQTSVCKSPILNNTSHQEVIYVTFTQNIIASSTSLSNTGVWPSIIINLPQRLQILMQWKKNVVGCLDEVPLLQIKWSVFKFASISLFNQI